ncbi:phosphoesterase RecJ domain-containing protein [Halovivax asiaticus JCM 14624]|uniref:Phosphoesterase RecJ domain-containing protein n=1 Tax=Halovivax asiaticus JCM 14624 TaxID=1227490 RepID=M0BP86_9EURY|nr:DHH family phosphoesterase [Halovivax asiaticus]ELZ12665.1 phosphoesterase RecJ domain-containing protein [Halovivax asiaticus JCM 14624]
MVRRLILGCGDVGERLAESLGAEPTSVLGIDADRTVVNRLRDRGVPARRGDPTEPATLDDLDPPGTILVAGDRADENLAVATLARDRFPEARLIVYAGADPTQTVVEQLQTIADDVVEGARALADRVLEEGASPAAERARRLRSALSAIDGRLAVVTHDNPDPDAIASAIALVALAESVGIDADACYYGEISHQENRAMLNVLDLEVRHLEAASAIDAYDGVALVDHSRPGINDGLATDADVDIVIDHHPPRGPVAGSFVDIRHLAGATSTVMTEYVDRFGVGFDRQTATALLFGIRIDTNDFTRETTALDFRAAAALSPHVDQTALDRIERPTVDGETVDTIARAIKNRERYGDVVVSSCGQIASRDALPQAADRLLSMDGVDTTLVYGFIDDMVYLSARSRDDEQDVGEVIRDAFEPIGSAGGHSDMAGAQLEIGVLGSGDADGTDGDGPDHAAVIVSAVEDVVEHRFIEAIDSIPDVPKGGYTRESELLFDPARSGVVSRDEGERST